MRNRWYLFLAVMISFCILSCGDGSTGPEPPEEDWLPLAVGNWWDGNISGYMLTGTSPDTIVFDGTAERRITALVEHDDGFQVYLMETIMEMTASSPDTTISMSDSIFIYLRNTGDEMRGYQDLQTSEYQLMARFPLTAGDSWLQWDDSTVTTEVEALDGSVTVPAGSYSGCAVLLETDSIQPEYAWRNYLHRGTGIVKDSVWFSDDQLLVIELASFGLQ
jgi:hypothetical protein